MMPLTKPVIISITASSPAELTAMLQYIEELRDDIDELSQEDEDRAESPLLPPSNASVHSTPTLTQTSTSGLRLDLNPQPRKKKAYQLIGVELNTSCPNIRGKPPPSYTPSLLSPLLLAIALFQRSLIQRSKHPLTIGLKLPPYVHQGQFEDIIDLLNDSRIMGMEPASDVETEYAEMLKGHPISFLTCTNTLGSGLLFMDDAEPGGPVHVDTSNRRGNRGQSGPTSSSSPLTPLSIDTPLSEEVSELASSTSIATAPDHTPPPRHSPPKHLPPALHFQPPAPTSNAHIEYDAGSDRDVHDTSLGAALPTVLGGLGGAAIHSLALGNVYTFSRLLSPSFPSHHPSLSSSSSNPLNALGRPTKTPMSALASSFNQLLLPSRPGPLSHIAIIGVGGVEDKKSADRMLRAGASIVGCATALGREGLGIFEKLQREQEEACEEGDSTMMKT